MKQTIMRWLQPPVFEGDDTKTSRAGLLNAVISTSIVLTAVLTFGSLLGENTPTSTRIVATLLLAALALGWRMLRSGRITFVAFALSIVLFISLTAVNIGLGTIRTPMAAAYLFWVIIVGMLFSCEESWSPPSPVRWRYWAWSLRKTPDYYRNPITASA